MDAKRRRVSEMWRFFDPVNQNEASCNLCKNKFSYSGSVSNLKKHIQRKHPTVTIPRKLFAANKQLSSDEVEVSFNTENAPVMIESLPSASTDPGTSTANTVNQLSVTASSNENGLLPLYSTSIRKRQASLTSCVPKKITTSEKTKIDQGIMKLFAWDFQPFSMVEDRGFKNLMHICAPSYKIPSKKYFANTMLPALYEETSTAIKQNLADNMVCLTTDSWTSSRNNSFMAITGHYITEEFQLKTVLLECSAFNEAHTSQNLADEIKSAINEWGLNDKISMIVSDNAANITGAVTKILNVEHYGCYAHKLNRVIQDSLPLVENTIKKVKSVFTYFKKSNKAILNLVKYQEQDGIKEPKRLLQDVVTNWNSTYYMLERFVLLEEAVKHSLALLDIDLILLTSEEWEICKELCEVLRPCEEVTQEMSSENYLTASKVIPITRGLKSAINKTIENVTNPIVQDVAYQLVHGIETRFAGLERSITLGLCTFLDPRYKHHMFEDEITTAIIKQRAIDLVTMLINQKINQSNPDEANSNVEPEMELNKNISVWDDYENMISKVKPRTNSNAMAIQEVQRYMDDNPISRKNDPLVWWKNHQHAYPNLARVMRLNCGIVATSVPRERILPKTGSILSDRRTRLTTQKVKQLAFLNMNLKS